MHVVYNSFMGRFSDNPRAVYERLRDRPGSRHTWLRDPAHAQAFPPEVATVAVGSPEARRALESADLVVAGTHTEVEWTKPDGTTYLQTWHGTPLKRIHQDVLLVPPGRLDYLDQDVARWDVLLSPNPVSTPRLRKAFGFDGPVWETGYPRNRRVLGCPPAPGRERRQSRRDPLDLGVSSMQLDRPDRAFPTRSTRRWTCGWIRAPSPRATSSTRRRARARRHLQALRRGAVRPPDRAGDRPAPEPQPFERTARHGRGDQGRDPRAGRFGEVTPRSVFPGAAHRGQRRARRRSSEPLPAALEMLRRGRLGVIAFHSLEDRIVSSFSASRARLHVSARLSRLRLRLGGDDARDAAPCCAAVRGRGGPQPAGAVRTPARRDEV